MTYADTAAVLSKTLDSIRTRGWIQGSATNWDTGECCLVGHIRLVMFGGPTSKVMTVAAQDSYQSVLDPIRTAIGTPEVAVWNDRPGRTQTDVEAAVILAAAANAGAALFNATRLLGVI